MRIIQLNPDIINQYVKIKSIDYSKVQGKTIEDFNGLENLMNEIFIVIDYDKNFHSNHTVKLYHPLTHKSFWMNHKDLFLIKKGENDAKIG